MSAVTEPTWKLAPGNREILTLDEEEEGEGDDCDGKTSIEAAINLSPCKRLKLSKVLKTR